MAKSYKRGKKTNIYFPLLVLILLVFGIFLAALVTKSNEPQDIRSRASNCALGEDWCQTGASSNVCCSIGSSCELQSNDYYQCVTKSTSGYVYPTCPDGQVLTCKSPPVQYCTRKGDCGNHFPSAFHYDEINGDCDDHMGYSGMCQTNCSCAPPTPVKPPPPTGLIGSCIKDIHQTSQTGFLGQLSWTAVPGAKHYAIRVDDFNNGVTLIDCKTTPTAPDFCTTVTTNHYSFSTTPGHKYNWWLYACNDIGCGPKAVGLPFECIVSTTITKTQPSITTSPPICKQNLDISIVIDRSGSMQNIESDGRRKLEWVKDAANALVKEIKDSGTNAVRVSVDSFGAQGDDGTGTLASTYNSTLNYPLSNNYSSAISAITGIKHIEDGTCIECGLRIANGQMINTLKKRGVILLSDGKANHYWNGAKTPWTSTSNPNKAAIVAANAGRDKGIEYWVLGYGDTATGDINETTLKAISGKNSSGEAGYYQYQPNPQDWTNAFLKVFKRLCQ